MNLRRKTIRRLFVGVMVLLPVQYALVGIVGSLSSEPWPVLVMPGFQRVWDSTEQIAVPTVRFEASFSDGQRAAVPHDALLYDLPRSHHRAFLETQFHPSQAPSPPPAALQWMRDRLDAHFPGRSATRLHAYWGELVYAPGARPGPPSLTLRDTLTIALR